MLWDYERMNVNVRYVQLRIVVPTYLELLTGKTVWAMVYMDSHDPAFQSSILFCLRNFTFTGNHKFRLIVCLVSIKYWRMTRNGTDESLIRIGPLKLFTFHKIVLSNMEIKNWLTAAITQCLWSNLQSPKSLKMYREAHQKNSFFGYTRHMTL